MATTARGGANSKQRIGVSPSNPQQKNSLKSPSSSSSSVCKTSFTSSEKSVPNYLKPTLSSPKSPSTDYSKQKSALERRRSFDRLPSALHLQKSFQGPASSKSQEKPVRSASFTGSTRNAPFSSRPAAERLSKGPMKDAKIVCPLSKGNSVKKSTRVTPKSVMPEASSEGHCRDVDHHALSQGTESRLKNGEEEKENAGGVDGKHEDAGKADAAQVCQQGHTDNHSKEEVIGKYEGGSVEELPEHEVKLEGRVNDGREENGEVKDEAGIGGKKKEWELKERKPEGQRISGGRQEHPGSRGRKETQVYNDVIEETASKLLQDKKNKVKALAGAFETVISLQESS